MTVRSRPSRHLSYADELQHREDQHDRGDQGHEAGADRAEDADLDEGNAADDPAEVQDDRRPRRGVRDGLPPGGPEEPRGVQHETSADHGEERGRRDTQELREGAGCRQEHETAENRRDSVDDERRAKQHDRTSWRPLCDPSARVAITPEVIVIRAAGKDDAKRREIMDKGAAINESLKGTLGELLGMRFVEAAPERVVAELTIRDELRTVGGALHGGTLMAFADTVGAAATVLNLPPGAGTTTLESKTNFFAAGRAGVVRAEATPLHRGKRTMVWQTRVVDESGRLLSMTIQTQMVLGPAA